MAGQSSRSLSAVRDYPTFARAALTVFVLSLLFRLFLLWRPTGYPFLAFALAGSFIILAGTAKNWKQPALAILLGTAIGCIYTLALHPSFSGWSGPAAIATFIGLGAITIAAAECLRPASAPNSMLNLFRVCLLPALVGLVPFINYMSIPLTNAQDWRLYQLDAALGFEPSLLAARLCANSPLLAQTCFGVYSALPLMAAVVYAIGARDLKSPFPLLGGLAIMGLLGSMLYFLMPALGPAYFFGDSFPFVAPDPTLATHYRPHELHIPNAMPSLHAAYAYLTLWAARSIRKSLTALALPFVLMTAFSTLGLCEHYLIDLVVAGPFALFVLGVIARRTPLFSVERLSAIAIGALLMLFWFAWMRSAHELSRVAAWMLFSTTIVSSFWLAEKLIRKMRVTTVPQCAAKPAVSEPDSHSALVPVAPEPPPQSELEPQMEPGS